MTFGDTVNGLFEGTGAFFILQSVIKLHHDKMVRGVSWIHSGFFAAWGYWNLWYYPSLGQWLSFWGGVGIVTTNTIWLLQILYYTRRELMQRAALDAARREFFVTKNMEAFRNAK